MELYRQKYRHVKYIGLSIILSILFFALNSCEQDEIASTKPVDLGNSCDTNNVSFIASIKPALDMNCKACHNNTDSYAGVNLEGYDNIKKAADNGKLLSGLFGNMSSYINNDCDFAKIKAWINQGSKNN